LIGVMVWRLTGNRWLSVIMAGLATQLDVLWYMEVGPNTIHVFFALLGTWLLIRMALT